MGMFHPTSVLATTVNSLLKKRKRILFFLFFLSFSFCCSSLIEMSRFTYSIREFNFTLRDPIGPIFESTIDLFSKVGWIRRKTLSGQNVRNPLSTVIKMLAVIPRPDRPPYNIRNSDTSCLDNNRVSSIGQ